MELTQEKILGCLRTQEKENFFYVTHHSKQLNASKILIIFYTAHAFVSPKKKFV